MAIRLGTQEINSAYLGSTALTQIYLGDVPLLGGGPQEPLPPITDGLVICVDAGVLASWDGVAGTHWNDIAGFVDGPYPYSKAASVAFVGTPGERGNQTYFLNTVINENFAEDPPGNNSFLEAMQQRDIGPYTYIAIVQPASGEVPGWMIANGQNQSTNRAEFVAGEDRDALTIEINFGGRTGGNTWNGAPTGVFPVSWNDRFRPSILTVVGDSSDSADCFTKLDGFPAQPIDTTHSFSNTSTATPRIGLYINNLTSLGLRYFVVLAYNRKLTEAEVTQIEDFYLQSFPDPGGKVRGSWGVRNLNLTDSNTGGRSWNLQAAVPFIGGVQQAGAFRGVGNPAGWTGENEAPNDNNSSDSGADVNDLTFSLLSAYDRTVDADGVAFFTDSNTVNNSAVTRVMIVSSDDDGVTLDDVREVKAYAGRNQNGDRNAEDYVYALPTAAMLGYSMKARSIIANYPTATTAEMDAMAVFIDTLEAGGYLDRMVDMYPLFLNGTLGLKSAFRAPNLELVGSPVRVDGGWWFPTSNDYMIQPSTMSMQKDGQTPHNMAAGAAAMTMFQISAVNHGVSGDYFEVFGANDGSLRFTRLEIQASNARIRDGLMRTGTNTGTSGLIPNALLPVGVPITWFTNANNHTYWKTDTNAPVQLNTSADTSDYPTRPLAINRIEDNGVIAARPAIGGSWSMFAMWELDGLDNTQRNTMLADVHAAMQTMMDAVGVVPIDIFDPIETSPDWTLDATGLAGPSTFVLAGAELVMNAAGGQQIQHTAAIPASPDVEFEATWLYDIPVAASGNNWAFPMVVRCIDDDNLIGLRGMDGALEVQERVGGVWGTTYQDTNIVGVQDQQVILQAIGDQVKVFVGGIERPALSFTTTLLTAGPFGVRGGSQMVNLGSMWIDPIFREV